MKILITGVSGFVGNNLSLYLSQKTDYELVGILRKSKSASIPCHIINDFTNSKDLFNLLQGVDIVIHLLRVHQMRDNSSNPLKAFRKVNVEDTTRLANLAVKAGVKRFIFISTIKVNGESTFDNESFSQSFYSSKHQILSDDHKSNNQINELDPYAISKFVKPH